MKNKNKNDEKPYTEYRFCCEEADGSGGMDGVWLDITKNTTPKFIQDGLDFLNSHTRLIWRLEYR